MQYRQKDVDRITGEDQHRLCCTAAARFLESVGITEHPIFSFISDGPHVVLASAWAKDETVHIFERHLLSFDISTAIGAWHYATVLARIAIMAQN
ncbi:hypothetical protein IEO21_02183 [Rhodonia placenta]|uniref:Uncharacterized protein n=1 Tax=Rhodonia placenta TaxID=104341 RepID=A0A8H7U543_9APHY|nr:hypothetical protein IEO21_02183 [Postia placenta]